MHFWSVIWTHRKQIDRRWISSQLLLPLTQLVSEVRFRLMSWDPCHEPAMKGHVLCWLSAVVFVCLRYVGRDKYRNTRLPSSPEPSRTTTKQKNTRKTCFFYSKMKVTNLPPLSTWKSDPGYLVELIYRGTWYRNSSTLITPSTRNYGYDRSRGFERWWKTKQETIRVIDWMTLLHMKLDVCYCLLVLKLPVTSCY